MYPAGSAPRAENWTMDTFLKAAEACHKAGVPFGIGLGQTTDSVDTAGAIFQAFGAELVDKDGKVTVRSEEHTSELQSRQYLVCRLLLEKTQRHHGPALLLRRRNLNPPPISPL